MSTLVTRSVGVSMACLNCGAESEDGQNFCAHCGVDSPATGVFVLKKGLCHNCQESFFETHLRKVESRLLCEMCYARETEKRSSDAERKAISEEKFRQSERAGIRSQRAAGRFSVAKCYSRLTKKGLAAKLTGAAKPRMGPLVDLSRTGLQCVAAGVFKRGDRVEIELLVPAFATPLTLLGTVRWAKPDDNETTAVGIEFEPSDIKTQKHLEALERYPSLREAAYLQERETVEDIDEDAASSPPNQRPADF